MKNSDKEAVKKDERASASRAETLASLSVEELVTLFMKEYGQAIEAVRALKGP